MKTVPCRTQTMERKYSKKNKLTFVGNVSRKRKKLLWTTKTTEKMFDT